MIDRLLIGFLALNGLLVAACKFFNINLPISPINALIIILLFAFTLDYFGLLNKKHTAVSKFFLVWRSVLLLFILIKIVTLTLTVGSPQLSDILYLTLFFCGVSLMDWGRKLEARRIFRARRLVILMGGIIMFISFVQYFFYLQLPSAFTDIPNINKEIDFTRYLRDVGSIQVYRPNGLIGNPINLGFFLNLVYLFIVDSFKDSSKRIFLTSGIAILMVLLASRANITMLVFQMLLFSNFRGIKKRLIILPLVFGLLVVYTNGFAEFLVFVVDRFTNSDEYAQASTNEHLNDYITALDYITNNPVFGISPAEVFSKQIITDGVNFFALLIFGIPFALLYLTFIAIYAYALWRKNLKRHVIWIAFTLIYGCINSAILNKSIFLLFHLYLGLRLAQNEKQQ